MGSDGHSKKAVDGGGRGWSIAKVVLIIVAVVAGIALLAALEVPARLSELLESARAWPRDRAALLVFGIVFVSTIGFFTTTPTNAVAGAILGVPLGSFATFMGCWIGALVAFQLGRTWMRDWTKQKVASFPNLRKLDGALARKGFLLVFLLRLSPVVPFSLVNYFLGASAVDSWTHAFATALGLLPAIVVFAYLGSQASASIDSAAPETDGFFSMSQLVNVALGIGSIVLTGIVVSRVIANESDGAQKNDGPSEEPAKSAQTASPKKRKDPARS